MPVVRSIYIPFHPHGIADFLTFEAGLRSVALQTGADFLQPSMTGPPQQWYVDDVHLNRAGARRLTTEISRQLAAALRG
jgi:hypothetical protein